MLGKIASKYVNMKHGQSPVRHKLKCPSLGKVTFKKVLKTLLIGVNWVFLKIYQMWPKGFVTYITKQVKWVV